MKKLALALALASLGLTTACGGDTESQVESAGAQASTAASEAADTAGDVAQSASPDATAPAGGGGQTLVARVGEEGDPDAFVISLEDESGQPVTSLPAGEYTIEVNDPSTIHNFHLTGSGVDQTTTVPGTGETTWDVTLTAGEYTYVCDPHPRMVGSFTVTA